MIDIKLIRDNPDKVKQAAANKGVKVDIDKIAKLDQERRKLQTSLDEIKAKKNKLGKEINKLSAEERDARIAALRAEDVKAEALEDELKKTEDELKNLMSQVPNIPDADVPVGLDESGNVVVKTAGEPRKFKFQFADYMKLAGEMDLIDTAAAAKVAGTRFGYIKGAAASLWFALGQLVHDTLTSEKIISKIAKSVGKNVPAKPFVPVIPPVMIKEEPYWKMARLEPKDERYYIPSDELYLIGSAEHTLGPMYMDEIINQNQLPMRFIGYSTAFRREAGSYGKDTKGIIRVHQFDKWEMESFVSPENARREFDFIVAIQEYLVQKLDLPYQLIMKCTGDIGGPNARGVDINTWLPGENKYRETHTADYMSDYQARRLNTRLRRANGDVELLHTIDATAATPRLMIAIIENYQQEDGSIEVPKALRPYLPFKKITGPHGMGK